MSDGKTPVPVGQRPPHGGRVKQYASDAERAAANRARKQAAHLMPDTSDITPENAVDALATILERLPQITEAFAARFEAAAAMVADPEAVAAAMAANAASCDEAVATANARAANADQARVEAEAAVRVAEQATEAATEHAAACADALREAETEAGLLRDEVARLQGEVDAQQEARRNAASAYEADLAARDVALAEVQVSHAGELADQRAKHDDTVAALTARWNTERDDLAAGHRRDVEVIRDTAAYEMGQLRNRIETVTAQAEADLAHLRGQLAQVHADLPDMLAAARDEVRAALEVQYAAELGACEARCNGKVAALRGELDACTARLEAANEVADRLRSQADD